MKRYTEDFVRCALCLKGNNFLIQVYKDKESKQNYLGTQCPKCNHHEEFKEITLREAKALEGTVRVDMPKMIEPPEIKNDYF